MQDLVIDNREEILQELQQLGFSNPDEILSSAMPLYSAANSSPTGMLLTDLEPSTSSKQTGFKFSFGRVNNTSSWEMESVMFSTYDQSDRSPGGGMPLARYWHLNDGPLPHKDRMRWEVKRAARIEAEKNHFNFGSGGNNTSQANRTAKIKPLNKELESELTRLGFPHYPEMLQTATFHEDLTFLKSQEKIAQGLCPGGDVVDFFFAVVYPENRIPLRIEYINASLVPDGPPNRELRVLTEVAYWLSDGALPAKDRVIQDIKRKLSPDKKLLGRAATLTANFRNRSPGQGLHR